MSTLRKLRNNIACKAGFFFLLLSYIPLYWYINPYFSNLIQNNWDLFLYFATEHGIGHNFHSLFEVNLGIRLCFFVINSLGPSYCWAFLPIASRITQMPRWYDIVLMLTIMWGSTTDNDINDYQQGKTANSESLNSASAYFLTYADRLEQTNFSMDQNTEESPKRRRTYRTDNNIDRTSTLYSLQIQFFFL
jgi:hypothetical protein